MILGIMCFMGSGEHIVVVFAIFRAVGSFKFMGGDRMSLHPPLHGDTSFMLHKHTPSPLEMRGNSHGFTWGFFRPSVCSALSP